MSIVLLLARFRASVCIAGGLLAAPLLSAQVTLSGSTYTQNFNDLANGLPEGWAVYTDATASSLGTAAAFTSTAVTWSSGSGSGIFRNTSSANIASTSDGTAQNNNTDRALGWRPSLAAERNGAITVAFANTSGFDTFDLSLEVFTFNNVTAATSYALEYRVGATGAFTQLGSTYATGTAFSLATYNFDSVALSALADQSGPLFIRLRGVTPSGTGTLDGVAIDNFTLTYSAIGTSAIPEPSAYALLGGVGALLVACRQRRRGRDGKATASQPPV